MDQNQNTYESLPKIIIWAENAIRFFKSLLIPGLVMFILAIIAGFSIPKYILPWIYIENYGETYRESQKIIPGQEVDIGISIKLDQNKSLRRSFLRNIKLKIEDGRDDISIVRKKRGVLSTSDTITYKNQPKLYNTASSQFSILTPDDDSLLGRSLNTTITCEVCFAVRSQKNPGKYHHTCEPVSKKIVISFTSIEEKSMINKIYYSLILLGICIFGGSVIICYRNEW